MAIIIHRDLGLDRPYAVAYRDKVDRRNRLSHVDCEYACGRYPANYPVPARIVTFEYWPASQTDNGKPAVYGHDHYKPGRW